MVSMTINELIACDVNMPLQEVKQFYQEFIKITETSWSSA